MTVEAERIQVLLAHHVVEVHPRARYHDARTLTVGAGGAARTPLGVEHRDVRGCPKVSGKETLQETLLVEPFQELGRTLRLSRRHRLHDTAQGWRRGTAIQERQRVCEQRPTCRGRRVGENLTIAVADLYGLALFRAIAREVIRSEEHTS